MSDTSVIKYRYKLPEHAGWATQSFGIEPYYTRSNARQIKAGAALIRCRIYKNIAQSRDWAKEASDLIVDLLSSGHTYFGPKTLDFNKPISVRGYFND